MEAKHEFDDMHLRLGFTWAKATCSAVQEITVERGWRRENKTEPIYFNWDG